MRICLARTSQYSLYIFWSRMSGIWTLHCTQVQYTIIISHHESLCTLKHLSLQSLRKKPPISSSPSPPSANARYLGLNHGRPGCHHDQRWNYSLLCRSWPHQTSSWPSVPGAIRRTEHPLLGWEMVQWWWGCQKEIQYLKQHKTAWNDSADLSFKDPNLEKIFRRGHQQYQGNLIKNPSDLTAESKSLQTQTIRWGCFTITSAVLHRWISGM